MSEHGTDRCSACGRTSDETNLGYSEARENLVCSRCMVFLGEHGHYPDEEGFERPLSSDGGGDEPCEHYDAQVGIQMTEIKVTDEQEIERYCDWCGGLPDVLLVKSQNDDLVFCEECRGIIRTLARSSQEPA